MKNKLNIVIVIAAIAMIAGFIFTYNRDYVWVGHLIAGVVTTFFLILAIVYGATLAGRLHRPAAKNRFRLHRKIGIAAGSFAVVSFIYGFWVMLPQGKRLMDTTHGWFGLSIAILVLIQIVPSLTMKQSKLKIHLHRWIGYLAGCLVVLQIVIGALLVPAFTALPPEQRIRVPPLAPTEETWQPDGVITPKEYYASTAADNGNYELHYRGDGTNVYIAMRAQTTGWVGVGVDVGTGMKNAGMTVGYVTDGKTYVYDSYGTTQYTHSSDIGLGGIDNIIEFGGKEENGFTTIEFKLPMVSGDQYDVPIVEGTHKIIWAYGMGDNFDMHSARGYIEVDLRPQ